MRVAEYEDIYWVDFGGYAEFIEIYKNGGNDYE